MTNPTQLSLAAQAVLNAYGNQIGGTDAIMDSERRGVVAALRAAADQLYDGPSQDHLWEIADELENNG